MIGQQNDAWVLGCMGIVRVVRDAAGKVGKSTTGRAGDLWEDTCKETYEEVNDGIIRIWRPALKTKRR